MTLPPERRHMCEATHANCDRVGTVKLRDKRRRVLTEAWVCRTMERQHRAYVMEHGRAASDFEITDRQNVLPLPVHVIVTAPDRDRDTCQRGHAFGGRKPSGARYCVECKRARDRERYRELHAVAR